MPQSNPFRKRNTLDASERTKQKKAQTMMKTLNTKPSNTTTKNYTMSNDHLTQTINHETKMDYTKGFYLLECSCNNVDEYVNTVAEGKYSYIDWSTVASSNIDPCDTNPIYELDDCRIEKGYIVPLAKIDPSHKERVFKYPIPIKKTVDCCPPPVNNITQPDHHNIDDTTFHQHYFPLSNKIVNYGHSHADTPHSEVYPHPNKDATNMNTVMSSLSQVDGNCNECGPTSTTVNTNGLI